MKLQIDTTTGSAILPRLVMQPGQRRLPRVVSIEALEAITHTPIGWEADAPREPLPFAQVLANIAALKNDPEMRDYMKARSFDLVEYTQAKLDFDAWQLRA